MTKRTVFVCNQRGVFVCSMIAGQPYWNMTLPRSLPFVASFKNKGEAIRMVRKSLRENPHDLEYHEISVTSNELMPFGIALKALKRAGLWRSRSDLRKASLAQKRSATGLCDHLETGLQVAAE